MKIQTGHTQLPSSYEGIHRRSIHAERGDGASGLQASSGADSLPVTAGPTRGTYIIHFSDSALLSRAVARGYVAVNGTVINLPDTTRQALAQADRTAQEQREAAYQEYIQAHEAAVARQQAETWAHALSGTAFEDTLAGQLLRYQAAQNYEDQQPGAEWGQLEWKTFETDLEIVLGEDPACGTVRVSERMIHSPADRSC